MSAQTRLLLARFLWPLKILEGVWGMLAGTLRDMISSTVPGQKELWRATGIVLFVGGGLLTLFFPVGADHHGDLVGFLVDGPMRTGTYLENTGTVLGLLGIFCGGSLFVIFSLLGLWQSRTALQQAVEVHAGNIGALKERAHLERAIALSRCSPKLQKRL
jgi:hypothetical protein